MRALNEAFDNAARFKNLMRRVTSPETARIEAVTQQTREVQEWNAEVERKRHEKHQRKLLAKAGR